jgi:hypothetical protein
MVQFGTIWTCRAAGARLEFLGRIPIAVFLVAPLHSTGHMMRGASAIVSGTVVGRKLSALITYHQPGMNISSRPRPALTSACACAVSSSWRSPAKSFSVPPEMVRTPPRPADSSTSAGVSG